MISSELPFLASAISRQPTVNKFQTKSTPSSIKSLNSIRYFYSYIEQLHIERSQIGCSNVHRINFPAMWGFLLQTCKNCYGVALRILWRSPFHFRYELCRISSGSHHRDRNVHHAWNHRLAIPSRSSHLHALHHWIHSPDNRQKQAAEARIRSELSDAPRRHITTLPQRTKRIDEGRFHPRPDRHSPPVQQERRSFADHHIRQTAVPNKLVIFATRFCHHP